MGRSQADRHPSPLFTLCTVFYFILTDIFLYGCIVPLLGTYLAGGLAYKFEMSPKWELVATVTTTFFLIYGTFCLVGEASYWKHLFSFDSFYCNLLHIRDVFNGILFIFCLIGLASTIEAMINQDKGIKANYVSEGAMYVFLKYILEFFGLGSSATLSSLGYNPPRKGTYTDPSLGENEKYEHGAAYMLLWAILTSCVAKLVYYNTLFTYLRAMEIFISMKPSFDDDEDEEDSRFSIPNKSTGRNPSKLDTDFAHSVKRTNI